MLCPARALQGDDLKVAGGAAQTQKVGVVSLLDALMVCVRSHQRAIASPCGLYYCQCDARRVGFESNALSVEAHKHNRSMWQMRHITLSPPVTHPPSLPLAPLSSQVKGNLGNKTVQNSFVVQRQRSKRRVKGWARSNTRAFIL